MTTIENKLKLIRLYLNMNQSTFAKALGVKQSYLSALESGKREPTAKLLYLLVKKFNISADWFITGKGSIITNDDSAKDNDVRQEENTAMYGSDVRFPTGNIRLEDRTESKEEKSSADNQLINNTNDQILNKIKKLEYLYSKFHNSGGGDNKIILFATSQESIEISDFLVELDKNINKRINEVFLKIIDKKVSRSEGFKVVDSILKELEKLTPFLLKFSSSLTDLAIEIKKNFPETIKDPNTIININEY